MNNNPLLKKLLDKTNAVTLSVYLFFLVGLLIMWHLFSDGDFSFLMTFSAVIRLFAFSMLLTHLIADKTAAGVSAKSLGIFALAYVSRLVCVWSYEGYLPLDKSGDSIPYIELLSICVVIGNLFVVLQLHRSSYAAEEDAFGKNVLKFVPHKFGPLYIVLPSLLVAMIFHPNLNKNFVTDTAWTFAAILESLAILPQLMMFQKSKKPVERWTSHFVFSLAIGRFMSLLFWLSSHHELSDKSITGGLVGYMIVLTELAGLAILADYSYYYLTAQQAGSELMFNGAMPGLSV